MEYDPGSHSISHKSWMQSKITHHSKNENNHKWIKKRQLPDAHSDITQILELFDNNLKVEMINLL